MNKHLKIFWVFFLLLTSSLVYVSFSVSAKEKEKNNGGWISREIKQFKSYPHLDMAYRLIKEEKYEEAIKELKEYLKIKPLDDRARLTLMYQYYNLKKYDQAISQATIILSHDPHEVNALLCRGTSYSEIGKTSAALKDFLDVVSTAREPTTKNRALKNALFILARQADYKRILRLLEKLPEREKDLDLSLLEIKALAATSQKDLAISKLSHLALKYSMDPIALKKIAVMADSLGETKRAIKLIKKSIELNPALDTRLILVTYLEKEGYFEEAFKILNSVTLPPANNERRVKIARKKGTLAYKLGKLKLAEKFYREALRVKRDPEVMRELVITLEKQGKLVEAEEEMAEAASLSRKPEYFLALGILQGSVGKDLEAVESLEHAIKLGLSEHDRLSAYQYLGFEQEKLGKLDKAEEAFKNALKIAPDNYKTNRALGELYLKLNKPELAQLYLSKASELKKSPAAMESLAVALEKQKKYRRALEILLQLERKTKGKDPQILTRIATLYSHTGNHRKAGDYFLKAFEVGGKKRYELLMMAATSYQAAGNPGTAIPLLKEYILKSGKKGQKIGEAHQELAILYLDTKEPKKALYHLNKALENSLRENTATKIHLQLGYLYARLGQPNKAISQFRNVLNKKRLSARVRLRALLGMANAQFEVRNYEGAEKSLERARTLATSGKLKIELFKQLGTIKLKQAKYSEARDYFYRLVEKYPKNVSYRLNLGYALDGMGLHEEAIEHFLEAYRMKKGPEILLAIANSYYLMKKPGVALHYLRLGKKDSSLLDDQKRYLLYEQCGYLALQEGALEEAEKALREALSIRNTSTARLYLGIVEARKGQPAQAISILRSGSWETLSRDKQILRKKELAKCYHQIGELKKSKTLWEELTNTSNRAETWFELGKVNKELGEKHEALRAFRRAVELDRNSIYLSAYGDALKENGKPREAIAAFKESLRKDPDQVDLHADLAYLYMQTYQNEEGVEKFKKAIDCLPLTCFGSPASEVEAELKREKYKREITALTKKFSFTAWDAFVTGDTGTIERGTLGAGDRILARGTMGFEGTWVLPRIGFRDYRILEAIARTTVNLREDSLDTDSDTWQGAIGLRYKPFKKLKFKVGMERLFSIGDDSEDNWLVRGLYDWSRGYELNTVKDNWNYSYLYSEINYYFPHRDRMLWYGELRQGWSFKVYPKFVLTPHLIADGIWYTPDREDSSFIEGGIGISGKYFWGGTSYLSDHHSAELLAYYKRGELTAGGVDKRKIDGFFLTLIISY